MKSPSMGLIPIFGVETLLHDVNKLPSRYLTKHMLLFLETADVHFLGIFRSFSMHFDELILHTFDVIATEFVFRRLKSCLTSATSDHSSHV